MACDLVSLTSCHSLRSIPTATCEDEGQHRVLGTGRPSDVEPYVPRPPAGFPPSEQGPWREPSACATMSPHAVCPPDAVSQPGHPRVCHLSHSCECPRTHVRFPVTHTRGRARGDRDGRTPQRTGRRPGSCPRVGTAVSSGSFQMGQVSLHKY